MIVQVIKMITYREGLILYWCEGDKYTSKNKYKVAVTSTDPRLLKLFIEWLEKYYKISKEKVKLRLHIWTETDEKIAKAYWSNELNMSTKNFTKSWIKRKGGRKKIHPYGICRVSMDSKKVFLKIMSDINQTT
jgi:asparagine synthetase B (glutamine-hydrolysing)